MQDTWDILKEQGIRDTVTKMYNANNVGEINDWASIET